MTELQNRLYARAPLETRDGIPVFSESDAYTANYEQIASDHVRWMDQHGTNPWMPERLWVDMERTTTDLIKKFSRPHDTILDVGVGLGRVLSAVPDRTRVGMDISFDYLRKARDKGIDVCYARIEDMPYRPASFDLVVCTDVLEHVIDLNLCCTNILSVLKPGGALVVRVPILENLKPYLDPSLPYEFVHLRTFDEYSLRLLFERVFRCTCVETMPAGYWPSTDRLRPWLPFAELATAVLAKAMRQPGLGDVADSLVRILYRPIDLNVVVRKPTTETMPVTR